MVAPFSTHTARVSYLGGVRDWHEWGCDFMRMTRTCDFQAPPEVVFSYIHLAEKHKAWMKGLVSEKSLDDSPDGVGNVTMMTMREGSNVREYRVETISYDPPRHVAITMSGGNLGNMVMYVDYRLTDLGGSCRLEYEAKMEIQGWFHKLLSPLFTIMGGRQLDKMFKSLKQAAEAESGRG